MSGQQIRRQVALATVIPAVLHLAARRSSQSKWSRARSMSLCLALLFAGCTTTGTGLGSSPGGAISATFTWTAESARSGTMTAMLSTGAVYRGPFFQVTKETRIDELTPLWVGWGGRWGWQGWDYWGPRQSYMTQYTGKVLANLEGPSGQMRCRFTLIRPSAGMAGGGQGRCQLPNGNIINANFPPH